MKISCCTLSSSIVSSKHLGLLMKPKSWKNRQLLQHGRCLVFLLFMSQNFRTEPIPFFTCGCKGRFYIPLYSPTSSSNSLLLKLLHSLQCQVVVTPLICGLRPIRIYRSYLSLFLYLSLITPSTAHPCSS